MPSSYTTAFSRDLTAILEAAQTYRCNIGVLAFVSVWYSLTYFIEPSHICTKLTWISRHNKYVLFVISVVLQLSVPSMEYEKPRVERLETRRS